MPEPINKALYSLTHGFDAFYDRGLGELFVRMVLGDIQNLGRSELHTRTVLAQIIKNYANPLSYNKLAQDTEITVPTAIEYIECLSDSFLLNQLFGTDLSSLTAHSRKPKKIYFADPFFLYAVKAYLSGADPWQTAQDLVFDEQTAGLLVEGLVVAHLISWLELPYMRRPATFIWWYKSSSGREVDVILKTEAQIWGIEVKYRSSPYKVWFPEQLPVKIVLTKDEFAIRHHVLFVPAYIFLACLENSKAHL